MSKIVVHYRGATYKFSTPQDAAAWTAAVERSERERRVDRAMNQVMGPYLDPLERLRAKIDTEAETVWSPPTFAAFVGRLRPAQKAALSFLVTNGSATDKELCAELDLDGNQALGGTLSGISQQAANLNIEAREIFTIENHRHKDKTRSTSYAIAESFRKAAQAMNWPPTPAKT